MPGSRPAAVPTLLTWRPPPIMSPTPPPPRPLPAPCALPLPLQPHVDSYDFFLGEGMQHVIDNMDGIEIEQPVRCAQGLRRRWRCCQARQRRRGIDHAGGLVAVLCTAPCCRRIAAAALLLSPTGAAPLPPRPDLAAARRGTASGLRTPRCRGPYGRTRGRRPAATSACSRGSAERR